MAETSRSSSFNYHVFLSFRGSDTRLGFTGNLYKALTDKGIHTFIDDEKLKRGEEITPALVKAIQESRIAIIVLSKDYASSSFCLDELATIIDGKTKGLLVIPVFFKVDPSDVRHQRGSYGEALAKHDKRLKHKKDKLQKWKEALRQVAELSGYHFKQGDEYEYKFIDSIVASVSENINHPGRLYVGDYLVGLEWRVAEVLELLDVGCDDGVYIIGIHGMGGIGKSTLARAVYNDLISKMFDGSCYLENVREKSKKNGLEHLQNILLHKILKDKNINVTSVAEGASMIPERLIRKKVLLVIDDVDNIDQLKAIVGRPNWFGLGSRVIITTRDKHLLKSHKVPKTYEVQELNEEDALQLLTWKAFNKERADSTYVEVLNRVLKYASGLPLALEVIGSNLSERSVEDWKSAIDYYERNSNSNGIHDILKVSFDALKNEVKSVFLDIACCLKGYKLTEVECILGALYDHEMTYPIELLVQKSLIKVQYGIVEMHDLIQDMGRQIDLEELAKKPGKWRRLWLPKYIFEVLKNNTQGTGEIEIIHLEVPKSIKEETIKWDGNGFKEMKNLKILIIKNAEFSEGPKCLPNSLRVLEWWGYPSTHLPSDFQPENLVICKLPNGCLTSFELDHPAKMFQNLTVLNFERCQSLTRIGDLSGLANLEKLSFKYCDNLITVHESIGHLGKVKRVSANGCRNLVSFPPIHLTSLEKLELSYCDRLESFPEISGKMENLRDLELWRTPIKELPISFVNLVGLQLLRMYNFGSVQLPSSILMMPQLTSFNVTCSEGMKWVKQEEEDEETMGSMVSSKLSHLIVQNSNLDDDFFLNGFTLFAHVTYLDLSGNNFTFLPEFFKEFQSLGYLDVSDCMHLQEIRGVPPNLEVFHARNCKSLTSLNTSMLIKEELYETGKLEYCCLAGAWIPEWLENKSRGASTTFWFRNKLPRKILYLLIAPLGGKYKLDVPAPMLFINGKAQELRFCRRGEAKRIEMDHTYLETICGLDEVSLEDGWNHVEFTYEGLIETSLIKAFGIHVFIGEGCDISYSDPNRKRKRGEDINSIESDNGGLVKRSRLVEKSTVSCLLERAFTYFLTQSTHCCIIT